MLEHIPIRLKLSLGHTFWLSILFVTLGFGLYRFVENNFIESIDGALLASAKSIRDNASVKNYDPFFMESLLEDFLMGSYVRSSAQLVDLSGKVSVKTPNLKVQLPISNLALVRAKSHLETYETFNVTHAPPIRQVTLPVMSRTGQFQGQLIQVGTSLGPTIQSLSHIRSTLLIALSLGFILSVLFGYFLTARSLRPVSDMMRAASHIGVDNLDGRLPIPKAKDELRNLAITFNDLLSSLQSAVGRLKRFAGDVSHELRTPISVVRGEAELALRRERTIDDYKEVCRTILSESEHMTQIVENLLLLVRAQSHALEVKKEKILVREFVEELRSSVRKLFEEKNISLDVDVKTDEEFFAHQQYLSMALRNILLNAATYSPRDSHVLFSVEKKEELIFRISDEGDGIDEADLPFIFDLFYRADAARNRKEGGCGIGLSLAEALVKLHKGWIKVTSKKGHGTTFEVIMSSE